MNRRDVPALRVPRIVVVQARLGSSRRPGKSLSLINHRPLISHVVERSLAIPLVSDVYVAIPEGERENPLEILVRREFGSRVHVTRGSENDVRSRFLLIAEKRKPCVLARVTADDPFKDPELYGLAFELLERNSLDYVWISENSLPIGLGVEVFSAQALIDSANTNDSPFDREHVTTPFRESHLFLTAELHPPSIAVTSPRLTVDYQEDVTFADAVARNILSLGGSYSYETTIEAARRIRLSDTGKEIF